jgi:multicomponent Na+:H+ antiporter subunit D
MIQNIMSIIPLFVLIPLGLAFLMPIIGKFLKRCPDILTNLAILVLFLLSLLTVSSPVTIYKVGGWQAIQGVPIGIYMVLDGLSILMLIIINLVGFLSTLYSVEYMKKYTDKTKYYTLFLLMIAGMNGVVLAGDLFNLFVFLEIAAIASYALVAFGTEAEELEAAFKYQVMGTVASGIILLAIAVLYAHVGTLNMADTAKIIALNGSNKLILFVGCLFLTGFGIKAALMPFHAWLPDAHPSAPAPISAMLSGVFIKAIGVYALIRILFNVLGLHVVLSYTLMVLATLSMLVGVLLAVGQWDFKRLLAYHSVSQMGYVLLGIGLATPLGILGGIFHLLNHSIFKSLLFLNSGSIVYSTGTRDLQNMGGFSQKMPTTSKTSFIASMSIAGIPPFNGFWSKLIIIIACIQANQLFFAVIAVIASILTLASFLKVQKYAFYGELKEKWKSIKEAPKLMCVSMIILALLCLVMGVLILPQVRELTLDPAVQVLGRGLDYAKQILGE